MECEFRKYSLFGGRFSDFRKDGGDVKTDEDRKFNAEKRTVSGSRDRNDRMDSSEEREKEKALERRYKAIRSGNLDYDDDEDIRSFHFHSLDHRIGKADSRERRERGDVVKAGVLAETMTAAGNSVTSVAGMASASTARRTDAVRISTATAVAAVTRSSVTGSLCVLAVKAPGAVSLTERKCSERIDL